jgi:hypothetical protein
VYRKLEGEEDVSGHGLVELELEVAQRPAAGGAGPAQEQLLPVHGRLRGRGRSFLAGLHLVIEGSGLVIVRRVAGRLVLVDIVAGVVGADVIVGALGLGTQLGPPSEPWDEGLV